MKQHSSSSLCEMIFATSDLLAFRLSHSPLKHLAAFETASIIVNCVLIEFLDCKKISFFRKSFFSSSSIGNDKWMSFPKRVSSFPESIAGNTISIVLKASVNTLLFPLPIGNERWKTVRFKEREDWWVFG